ncbi:MAG: hypothetical protein AB8B86_04095 [Pseudomonadales bacterium]
MSSQKEPLRPGIRLGAYPQRSEPELNAADKFVDGIAGKCELLRSRRELSLEEVTRRVNLASLDIPELGTHQFLSFMSELRVDLLSQGMQKDLIARAFAAIRALAEKTLGMRHHDVQLLAGWAMAHGHLIEMGTGEGKSLTATLVAGSAALAGIPVHVITTNEYLAERDALELHPLYDALGVSCAFIKEGMSTEQRREAYKSDICYCTNKQVAFDYLRDRLVTGNENSQLALKQKSFDAQSGPVLRGLCFAIVDEADSVLIDEACTPLLLSREISDPDREELYRCALGVAQKLEQGRHFQLKLGEMQLLLNDSGKAEIQRLTEDFLGNQFNGLWRGKKRREWLVQQALQALHLYNSDEHYLVRNDAIEIIDANTGRTMPDRAWQQGLHQMVECKENCALTGQRETLARISYQRFYLRYLHLTGMSGTLREVSGELQAVYNKATLVIPPHKLRKARNCGSQLYATSEQKWRALLERVKCIRATGQPILLGTASVASSELLSDLLNDAGIAHMLLSARQDAEEARIIKGAGLRNAVTVATNMAGRGTDIKLGSGVAKRGGLHVIACEPNQSARVDRQLFGRCGRQGQVGSFELFVSLDDALVSNYLPPMAVKLADKHRLVSQSVLNTALMSRIITALPQRAVQSRLRAVRRQVLQQDRQMDDLLAFSGSSE